MAKAVLLQVGTTVPALVPRRGDFDRWFTEGLAPLALDVVRPHEGDPVPAEGAYDAIVVTGSSAMVTEAEAWSLAAERWLAAEAHRGAWVLGVCYGHQLLARALDGEAGWNPNGREIGTVEVKLTPEAERDPLFGGLDSPLVVQESHSQSVLVLPPGARRLAYNAHDEHQAFAWGERAWGTQFHPEFDADIARGYIDGRREALVAEGLDPEVLLARSADGPAGAQLLARFAELVAD